MMAGGDHVHSAEYLETNPDVGSLTLDEGEHPVPTSVQTTLTYRVPGLSIDLVYGSSMTMSLIRREVQLSAPPPHSFPPNL